MTSPPLNPSAFFEALNRHGVEYILVGGYAAQQYGARRPTFDIDITPSTSVQNLERLAAVLKELRAGIRVSDLPEGLPFDTSTEALRGLTVLNLRTPDGDFDLAFSPTGIEGYEDLARSAESLTIAGFTVRVAALDDIIRSKSAANRIKDREALPELERLAYLRARVGRQRRSVGPGRGRSADMHEPDRAIEGPEISRAP